MAGRGNKMGRGPAGTFWDVLWKRDGVKVKKLHADPKAPRALLHNPASLTKVHCKNNLNSKGKAGQLTNVCL